MTTADGDGEKSTFRCLDVVRYVVAAAVTILIMAVIVNAVKVVLRPESLHLSVAGGSISAAPEEEPHHQQQLAVGLNVRAMNPSGRARIYYVNVTAYLFDKTTSASSSTPDEDSIFHFELNDMQVTQQGTVDSLVSVYLTKNEQLEEAYFDLLYNGSRISDATLRLDGNLITEVRSKHNETRPTITSYYCDQLLVGGDADDLKNRQDVMCKQQGS